MMDRGGGALQAIHEMHKILGSVDILVRHP